MFARKWLRDCVLVPASVNSREALPEVFKGSRTALAGHTGSRAEQSKPVSNTAPTPPPAFWGPSCSNTKLVQLMLSKSLLRATTIRFPCSGPKQNTLVFNKQAVAAFIDLLRNFVPNVFVLTVLLIAQVLKAGNKQYFFFPGWNCTATTWNTRASLQKKYFTYPLLSYLGCWTMIFLF